MVVKENKKITLKAGIYKRKRILKLLNSDIPAIDIGVQCPRCKKKGFATIPTSLLQKNDDLLTITFVKVACEHCFKIYIDEEMNVRSVEVSDFIVEREKKNLKKNILNKIKRKK